ncbi:MAG: hypothetical protein M1817_005149 [Caeruleum heppii]|nr:MAG: hypothetical protein M1817_005149 [Caeruleum heppii]
MLNDILSLAVGYWAVSISHHKPSEKFTYGWQRAETLGALVNGVFLVALCLSIFLEAIQRLVEPQIVSNPFLVLIVGCLGLLSNILGLFLFHDHGHSHGNTHNGARTAEEGFSQDAVIADEGGNVADVLPENNVATHNGSITFVQERDESGSTAPEASSASKRSRRHRRLTSGSRRRLQSVEEISIHPASFRKDIINSSKLDDIESGESTDSEIREPSDGFPDENTSLLGRRKSQTSNKHSPVKRHDSHASHYHARSKRDQSGGHSHGDLNMRGVFLHVMGDALGNIGVIASALFIWLTTYSWRFYSDPLISLVITCIILASAVPLCKAASRILLQAVPAGISVDEIKEDVQKLPGVIGCHHVHVWQLSDTKLIASLHIQVGFDFKGEGSAQYMKLALAVRRCLHAYGIHSSTIQPEFNLRPNRTVALSEVDGTTDVSPAAKSTEEQRQSAKGGVDMSKEQEMCFLECGDDCGDGSQCCAPGSSEDAPAGSTPHHLIFVADPQLVDPHTYPGRPWPLSTLTVRYTDLYLRRAYTLLQRHLHPDTIFFLGDLFDGGREWNTGTSISSEDRWKRYGAKFWLQEYDRFGSIFYKHWADGNAFLDPHQRGRKIISSLPGNHDLGLGVGVQIPIRNRFNAYFGDGNRVDVIANHTFVSVDSVSLSAMGQSDPATGSQGTGLGDGPGHSIEEIWKPTASFLEGVKAKKQRVLAAELDFQRGIVRRTKEAHLVVSLNQSDSTEELHRQQDTRDPAISELPTILLTHVPLYRPGGTPCGPLREHWPPSRAAAGQDPAMEKDERNAIAVQRGYQYQNVLYPDISKELVEKIGNVGHVFSGDDHDYCEVVHRGYTSAGASGAGGIREITVKSISFAMGVRKPGFVMLSLWNPIDNLGRPMGTQGGGHGSADSEAGAPTLESHLCLLPDQIGIYLGYFLMMGATFVCVLVEAVLQTYGVVRVSDMSNNATTPLLPLSKSHDMTSSAETEKSTLTDSEEISQSQSSSDSSSGSSSLRAPGVSGLAARNVPVRTRSPSPAGGYGIPISHVSPDIPLIMHARSAPRPPIRGKTQGALEATHHLKTSTPAVRGRLSQIVRRTGSGLWQVAWMVLLWYFWLVWTG